RRESTSNCSQFLRKYIYGDWMTCTLRKSDFEFPSSCSLAVFMAEQGDWWRRETSFSEQ
ncbi:hypothetical protein HAX54_010325, partial [Datura stramonium]|nr:hypothetical protein [Datura stramonium]